MVRKILLVMVVGLFAGSMISCAKKQTVQPTEPADEFKSAADAEEPSLRGKEYQKIAELAAVNFDYDKSDIRPDARAALKANAAYLAANATLEVLVEGHCDERGTIEYNMALGQRRATAVRSYYAQLGVSAQRISTISYGEERPVDFGTTESAYAKNRRAETLVRVTQ